MFINVHKNYNISDVDVDYLKNRIKDLESTCAKLTDESVSVKLHILKHDGLNHKDNIEIKVSIHIPKVSFQASTYCYKVNEGIEGVVSKLKKQISKSELKNKIIFATRQLAKRQMTWMRKMENLEKFDPFSDDLKLKVSNRVKLFLAN